MSTASIEQSVSPKPRAQSARVSGDRNSFIPRNDSPGPAAYSPRSDFTRERSARTAFGSSTRDNESNRWISSGHHKGQPPKDGPGPANYRTHTSDAYASNPKNRSTPSWGFGTASQRIDETKTQAATSPGPIYSQQAEWDAVAHSFAPPGSIDVGMSRSRDESQRVFISKGHSNVDRRAQAAEVPGPGAYACLEDECLSARKRGEVATFGKSSRDVRDSLSQEHIKADPLAGMSRFTPGAVYAYPSTLDKRAQKFGSGVKTYSPELGISKAGPYIGRGHESMTQGVEGPGPGAYNDLGGKNKAATGLGDAPTWKFGTEARLDGGPTDPVASNPVAYVPGPGTYNPRVEAHSHANAAPHHSMGPNLRSDPAPVNTKGVPGPGAYNIGDTTQTKSVKPASYSMGAQGAGGRTHFVPKSTTPGSGSYSPRGGMDDSRDVKKGKGFSFGAKEKTVTPASMVTVRYQGPLGQMEMAGIHSPGPGVYHGSEAYQESHKTSGPKMKFGTASRGARVFLSKMHAMAETGLESPGPGTYNQTKAELADVTSRYNRPASAAFSTTARFKSGVSTF